jgi:hypothetical protein
MYVALIQLQVTERKKFVFSPIAIMYGLSNI